MIRFSEIIKDSADLDPEKKVNREEVNLSKTGILYRDKVEEKNRLEEARVHYQKLLTLANQVQSWVQKSLIINISSILPVLDLIIENNLIDSLYSCFVLEAEKGSKLKADPVPHSVDVTIFSLKIGTGMGYDKRRLSNLAMIAFLHDVGMYRIPQNILNKKGKLSKAEFKIIQRHPEIGAGILSKLRDRYRWLVNVALQIHERADGSGYPRGLKGKEIHEYAYIIGLVDMYSAMIKDRPYRERIGQNRAMREIVASCKGKFPIKIVKVFFNQISFFPLNSYVKLNDRSVGRVISTNPNFPLKPAVEILYDNLGNRLAKARIADLSRQTLLYITGTVDEKDII
jgi:HD-GYP domain-containing protein (c-di-GMP phosphodiesterase class II)